MKRKQLLTTALVIMTATAANVTAANNGNVAENVDFVEVSQNRILIDLHVGYTDPDVRNKPIGRSPVQTPSIYIDGHTIYLNGYAFDEVQIVATDENGDGYTVYSSVVPEGAETVEIPDDIAGEYEIRLCRGGYYFYGEIFI